MRQMRKDLVIRLLLNFDLSDEGRGRGHPGQTTRRHGVGGVNFKTGGDECGYWQIHLDNGRTLVRRKRRYERYLDKWLFHYGLANGAAVHDACGHSQGGGECGYRDLGMAEFGWATFEEQTEGRIEPLETWRIPHSR